MITCQLCKKDLSNEDHYYITLASELEICQNCYSEKFLANNINIDVEEIKKCSSVKHSQS